MLRERFPLTPRPVIGLLIIVLGVVFTLDNLRVIEAGRIIRYWPVGFIVIGATVLAHARALPGYLAGSAWLFIGSWLLLDNLGLVRYDLGDLWPLLLVLVGIHLIWQAAQRSPTEDAETVPTDRSGHLNAVAVMAGIGRSSGSADFKGGELVAVMGGCEIDLSRASIASGEAVIDVFVLWGGIDLRVPPDWAVEGRLFPIMAGFEDKTQPPKGDTSKRLVIRGLVLMGGVEVKN
jgi:predicted membrane protein